jgi:hypothetical protein
MDSSSRLVSGNAACVRQGVLMAEDDEVFAAAHLSVDEVAQFKRACRDKRLSSTEMIAFLKWIGFDKPVLDPQEVHRNSKGLVSIATGVRLMLALGQLQADAQPSKDESVEEEPSDVVFRSTQATQTHSTSHHTAPQV